MLSLKWPTKEETWFSHAAAVHIPTVNTHCIHCNAIVLYHTFSDRASSRVARAVSVLLESVCRDLTLSFRFPSCLSLSRSCSCRFSIWHRQGGGEKKSREAWSHIQSSMCTRAVGLRAGREDYKSLKINTLYRQHHVHSLKCAGALQRSIFHFKKNIKTGRL